VNFAGRRVPLPGSKLARVALGLALMVGGLLGFLPILGFWMVPLGLIVLSSDFARVRAFRRRAQIWWGRKVYPLWAKLRSKPAEHRAGGARRGHPR